MQRLFCACLSGALLFIFQSDHAWAACSAVGTPTALSNIRNNLAGQYCLTNDIDMSGVANFDPIGHPSNALFDPFTGSLDGRGHVIRKLTITSSEAEVGLFAVLGGNGVIKNLSLFNAKVTSTTNSASVGGIAGRMRDNARVDNVFISGTVSAAESAMVGGIAGRKDSGDILRAHSAAAVQGTRFNQIGGVLGEQSSGKVSQSIATGPVTSGDGNSIGGLVGNSQNDGTLIEFSYATGPVKAGGSNRMGGLVGKNDAPIRFAFALGAVTATGALSNIGGLIGDNTAEGILTQVYAAGLIAAGASSSVGGIIGFNVGTGSSVLWDVNTSGQTVSSTGTPLGAARTTNRLQAALPRSFGSNRWSISPGLSYPHLTVLGFDAPLATTVFGGKLYIFLPLGQRERFEYLNSVAHADEASQAAAYTMIARAIGVTRGVASLVNVKIDQHFWDDASQTAQWTGPVTAHASLGPLRNIRPPHSLDETNVMGPLSRNRLVVLRGRYRVGPGVFAQHWMLATSLTAAGNVVANDPWTGTQVEIDPTTKNVVSPADFPLNDFTVNGYAVVALQ